MSKYVKQLEMSHLERRLQGVSELVFINVVGVDAIKSNQLRLELRKKGILLQVVKNTLARKVLAGQKITGLDRALEGPTAVAWGGPDIVALAKEITDWAKKIDKLVIKGGCVQGTTVDASGVEALSKMPSRVELLGRIVAQIQAPGGRLVAIANSPGAKLASQLKSIYEKKDEPTAETAAAAT